MLHLNSQAKGPLPDRTLESFLINAEGVISNILEKSLRQKDRVRNSTGVSYLFLF